jgi:enoyl-CoA hydratase
VTGRLHVTDPVPGVRLVEIDHPPANCLGSDLLAEFAKLVSNADADRNVRVLVIFGRHGTFSAGADLKEMSGDDVVATTRSELAVHQFIEILDALDDCRPVVIAAIDGHCIGGGLELALCCDIRIASNRASFVCAGVNVGLMASAYRLPRIIGAGRAKAMLLSGAPYDAEAALAWGLVTRLHPADTLLADALRLAERIVSRAPLSIEATKRIADCAFDIEPGAARRQQAIEMSRLLASNDHREALVAFREKRTPRFRRR